MRRTLRVFVGVSGSEGFMGCAADVVSTMGLWVRRTLRVCGLRRRCGINDLRVLFREAATSKRSREVEKQT